MGLGVGSGGRPAEVSTPVTLVSRRRRFRRREFQDSCRSGRSSLDCQEANAEPVSPRFQLPRSSHTVPARAQREGEPLPACDAGWFPQGCRDSAHRTGGRKHYIFSLSQRGDQQSRSAGGCSLLKLAGWGREAVPASSGFQQLQGTLGTSGHVDTSPPTASAPFHTVSPPLCVSSAVTRTPVIDGGPA